MKKILVVDDDIDILYLIKYILTSRGFDVHTHTSGLNLPEVINYYTPHLILLDIRLPGKPGTQICKEIKRVFKVPIIFNFSLF